MKTPAHQKDLGLAELADRANAAQFVSYDPHLRQRFTRLRGLAPDFAFPTIEDSLDALMKRAVAGSVNVRSFDPAMPESHPFDYGIGNRDAVAALVKTRADEGLYTIVNETIDIHDGGVSGVVLGGVVEFAPDDTPRAVDKPGICKLDLGLAAHVLQAVYGVPFEVDSKPSERIEFSLHPMRVGYRSDHILLWEIQDVGDVSLLAEPAWPNRFSRHIGDKVFGLLIADAVGLPVPATTVIGRRVAPFRFGTSTGTGETWLRTCPIEQEPGLFTTKRGWIDPFVLMQLEDPSSEALASVIAQEGVEARWSGATALLDDGEFLIEGVSGSGEAFMQGSLPPEVLPNHVVDEVQRLVQSAAERVGPARIEWVHDSHQAWVVQLHLVTRPMSTHVIYPGTPSGWIDFDVEDGLAELRNLVLKISGSGRGVVVRGEVGLTSHVGDILRRAQVPARLEGHPPAVTD